jgi:predicted metal-dependent phosphoesterase TrpH
LIDLHTHTTASDGRLRPADLVAAAAHAGVTVLSVTDHDTLAGCREAADAAAAHRIEFVAGIEITAIEDEVDVHVLGYFLDVASPALAAFLAVQRRRRIDRVRQMISRLAALGIMLDADAIVATAESDPAKSVGRPAIARALVAAGHVATADEAFARWLERGRPGFVPRAAAPPEEIFARLHDAGGIASLAHPGLLGRDPWIRSFVDAGLDALEAYHSDHDAADTQRYLELAAAFDLAVSGGSDYHGTGGHGPAHPGATALPRDAYEALERRATSRATASGRSTSS